MLGIVVALLLSRLLRGGEPNEARDVPARLASASNRLGQIIAQIDRERTANPFLLLCTRAEAAHRNLKGFPLRRADKLKSLARPRHERQLARFLDQFKVKDCKLHGFGRGLFSKLLVYRIETAGDLT